MSASETRAKEISDALRAPFDPSVIEQKQGKSYIGHEVIRDRVIEATGNQFDWLVESTEYRDDGAIKGRADRESGEIRTPLTCVCRGVLTIPGLGSRTGVGVQVIEFGGGEDAPYKGAESDAFKRAAMAFGVALQLYMNTPVRPGPQRPQQAPERPTEALTDKQFSDKLLQAMTARDGQAFRELSAAAGKNTKRWKALIQVAESEPVLDWVLRQMERFNVTDQNLLNEADARRGLLKEGALAPA